MRWNEVGVRKNRVNKNIVSASVSGTFRPITMQSREACLMISNRP